MTSAVDSSRSRIALCCVAWLLSLAVLAPVAALDPALAGVPRCGLAWLPWLVVIGLPIASPGAANSWGLAAGLALPSVALAAWFDVQSGAAAADPWGTVLLGAVLFALLGLSAQGAARAGLRWYAPVWLALLLGTPTLAAALEWVVGGELAVGGEASMLAQLSPLGALGLGGPVLDAPVALLARPALITTLALFALVAFSARLARGRAS